MTPEESDARLRRIHEEWRRWCEANRGNSIRRLDDGAQRPPLAKATHASLAATAPSERSEGATP
jgi:hypothetical protein